MRMLIIFLLLAMGGIVTASEGADASPWHSTWLLEAVGVFVAILLTVLLWIFRKIAAGFIHLVVILMAVGLLLIAVFGRSYGVYDVILGTSYAAPDAPLLRLKPMGEAGNARDVETYDPNAPTFEEFYRENPE